MARVVKADLTGGISTLVSSLKNDDKDTTNLLNAINSFINDSQSSLVGVGYDTARKKMGLYLENVQTRRNLSSSLASAISQGASSLASYMEEFDVLDDSQIMEIEQEIKKLRSKISGAKQTINRIIASNLVSERPISTSWYYQQISSWESTIKELNRKLDKLLGLGGADGAAFSQVSSLGGDVAKYDASIQGIKVSSIR